MNQKFSYLQSFKIIVLALLVAVGTGYLFADFTAPTQAPPGCPAGSPGCDAPLNSGRIGQTKIGGLTLNTGGAAIGLKVFGKSVFDSVQITGGAATGNAGKVLKFSDDLGNITWSDTAVVTPEDAQAIPAYGIETVEGTSGYNVAFVCRLKISDGSVSCFKAKGSPINKLLSNWVGIGTEIFSATTLGSYDLSCAPGRATYNRPFCCRIDKNNGDVECKYAKDTTLTNWVSTTDTDFPNPS